MPKIDIKNLTVEYGGKRSIVTALDDLSLSIESGTINVVIGYSGCGKTTLLKAIASLVPYYGDILFDGENINTRKYSELNMSYVTQTSTLYSGMTIFDNIALPLKIKKLPKDEIVEQVKVIAGELDISCCLTRRPKYVSGGQQQRAAIAKALIKKPSVCLFDEPLSDIDEKQRVAVRSLVKSSLKKSGSTVVYVTHDITEAMILADNLIVMDDGKIAISGAPSSVYDSDNEIMKSLKVGVECYVRREEL